MFWRGNENQTGGTPSILTKRNQFHFSDLFLMKTFIHISSRTSLPREEFWILGAGYFGPILQADTGLLSWAGAVAVVITGALCIPGAYASYAVNRNLNHCEKSQI